MSEKTALNPMIMPALFADPKAALRQSKRSKAKLRTVGDIGVPGIPKVGHTDQCIARAEGLLQKEAAGWMSRARSGIGDALGNVKKWMAPGGKVRPGVKLVGGLAAATGVLAGGDYLADQARTVGRARGYRDMMNAYGDEITAITELSADVPVPQERIRQAYNALHTVSPDIARDPTLAAASLGPVLMEMGRPHGYMDPDETKPRVMLEQGVDQFSQPSALQGKIPRRRLPSEYVATAAGIMGGAAKLKSMYEDPQEMARQQQAGKDAALLASAAELARRQQVGKFEAGQTPSGPDGDSYEYQQAWDRAAAQDEFKP